MSFVIYGDGGRQTAFLENAGPTGHLSSGDSGTIFLSCAPGTLLEAVVVMTVWSFSAVNHGGARLQFQ